MRNKKSKLGIQDIAKELMKLEQYKKRGLITEDELKDKKKCLLTN